MENERTATEMESSQDILSEMYRYSEYAVTGDSEKQLVRNYADRLKVSIERELRDAAMENAVLPAVCIRNSQSENLERIRNSLEVVADLLSNVVDSFSSFEDTREERKAIETARKDLAVGDTGETK